MSEAIATIVMPTGTGIRYNFSMLMILLQAAQQAKQIAPNVYVTVQQPSGTMPVWGQTLISAGVGAAFGVVGNVAMEYVKPAIQRRSIDRQLAVEMTQYYEYVLASQRLFKEKASAPQATKDKVLEVTQKFLNNFTPERFSYFSNNQQSLVFTIKSFSKLRDFYGSLCVIGTINIPGDKYEHFTYELECIAKTGKEFLSKHYGDYVPNLEIADLLIGPGIDD